MSFLAPFYPSSHIESDILSLAYTQTILKTSIFNVDLIKKESLWAFFHPLLLQVGWFGEIHFRVPYETEEKYFQRDANNFYL